MKQKLQFACALAVAALFSDLFSKTTWVRCWRALQVLVGSWRSTEKLASADVYRRRLETCGKCPVYYRPLATCGTPLRKELRGVGCHCHMKTKAKFQSAQCWLDENAKEEDGTPDKHGWQMAQCDVASHFDM